jgi:hypothetical protein
MEKLILSPDDDRWVSMLLETIPTYKMKSSISCIAYVATTLKINPNVLVIGAGQGAEVVAIDRWTKNANIWAIDSWMSDSWKESFLGATYLNIKDKENTLDNFIDNCRKWMSNTPTVIRGDVRNSDILPDQQWDLVYYDAMDLTKPNEWDDVWSILDRLWDTIVPGGILMGDDYFSIDKHKLTNLIDQFAKDKQVYAAVDTTQSSPHWIMLKPF